jgi:hypothetical protein
MNDLSTTNGGTLIEVPEPSPSMRGCLARVKTVTRFGTDDNPRDDAEIAAGEWITPKWVSESLRDEAARLLPVYERAATAVSDQTFQRWLNVLWLGLPKANGGAERWDAIKVVYAALLDDFPAACFSKRTLRDARDRFKFFPSTNELAAFLTTYRNEVTNAVYRLRVISKTTTERENWTEAPVRPKRTEQELRQVGDICAGIRTTLDENTKATRRGGAMPRRADRPTAAPTAKELDEARAGMPPKQPEPAEPTEPEAVA